MNDDETKRNAARYEWLRDHANDVAWTTTTLVGRQWVTTGWTRTSAAQMDADIDGARGAEQEPLLNPKATPPPLLWVPSTLTAWVRHWLARARASAVKL